MLSVATTSQLRKLEANWIKSCNARWGQVLMEIAGAEAAKLAYRLYLENPGEVIVLCGNGNNGGDGLVIARYLKLWQVPVSVWLIQKKRISDQEDQKMSTEEGQSNKLIAQNLDIQMHSLDEANQPSFDKASLIIDALLGTGLDRPIVGLMKAIIERVNTSSCNILSVDVPSGINSDTGQIMGSAIKATNTVVFGYLKTGLLCYPAYELCGVLNLVDIGLPSLGNRKPSINLTTVDQLVQILPSRQADSNKGTFGTLLTIAGSLGMSGASLLCAESSLRVGAGLTILATPKSLALNLPAKEVIYKGIAETDRYSIHPDAIDELAEYIEKASAIVLGPGLSMHPQTVEFVHKFVSNILPQLKSKPCLIDADGLNAIAKNPDYLGSAAPQLILTPHPKELSRLIEIGVEEIQADRIKAALTAASRFHCVVVLKGANSVIADQEGNVFINPTGSAGMAKAGAGDVLSGIIGGLLAEKISPMEAAIAGTYIHGRAGEIASEARGLASVFAGDIVNSIPNALATVCDGIPSRVEESLSELVEVFR